MAQHRKMYNWEKLREPSLTLLALAMDQGTFQLESTMAMTRSAFLQHDDRCEYTAIHPVIRAAVKAIDDDRHIKPPKIPQNEKDFADNKEALNQAARDAIKNQADNRFHPTLIMPPRDVGTPIYDRVVHDLGINPADDQAAPTTWKTLSHADDQAAPTTWKTLSHADDQAAPTTWKTLSHADDQAAPTTWKALSHADDQAAPTTWKALSPDTPIHDQLARDINHQPPPPPSR